MQDISKCAVCLKEILFQEEPIFYHGRPYHQSCFRRWVHSRIIELCKKRAANGLEDEERKELSELEDLELAL